MPKFIAFFDMGLPGLFLFNFDIIKQDLTEKNSRRQQY